MLAVSMLLALSAASCTQEKPSSSETTEKEDKVKINLDAEDKKVEVETDKVDFGLQGEKDDKDNE